MFCGWGHPFSCRCVVCRQLSPAGTSFRRKRAPRKRKKANNSTGVLELKKPIVGVNGQPIKPFCMSDFSAEFPTLWDFLTCSMYDGGEVRLTASLTFFVQDGTLKSCINDRDIGRSAFFTGETWEELLDVMERNLKDDTCDWRVKSGPRASGQTPPY